VLLVSQGSESTICILHQHDAVSQDSDPEVLDDEDTSFHLQHLRKKIRNGYHYDWHHFRSLCEKNIVEPITYSLVVIVKIIKHLFNGGQ